MALQCLAIIGKINEPLYLKDIRNANESGDENDENDVFGFAGAYSKERLSLRKEFMMHASIDSLEEAMNGQSQRKGRSAGETSKWMGLLCPMEESYIYGYVTPTNIKFLAMVSEATEPNREVHLKALFAKMHNLFVEYMLNPWSTLQNRIESKRFDDGIHQAIREYNETSGIAWA